MHDCMINPLIRRRPRFLALVMVWTSMVIQILTMVVVRAVVVASR